MKITRKTIGVYKLTNIINGKVYVGSGYIKRRESSHFSNLKRQTHNNKHLQASYNKYGKEAFVWTPILICESKDCLDYEQKVMDMYKETIGWGTMYNICPRADRKEVSEETRQKLSKALKGKKHSREQVINQANATRGQIRSEETRQKLSKALRGKKHSREHVINQANAIRGRKVSEEVRRKNSLSKMGIKPSEETKKLWSKNRTGYKNANAKLKDCEIEEIRRLNKLGINQMMLAKMFKVVQPHISRIIRNVSREVKIEG